MEGTVRVPLTLEGQAEKAHAMARLVRRIEGVKAEAKEKAAKYREEIDGLLEELSALATAVQEGAEQKAQRDLTFTEAEAAKALATIGAAAGECSCAGGPEAEVKDPACPTHGVAEEVATIPPREAKPKKARKRAKRAEASAS